MKKRLKKKNLFILIAIVTLLLGILYLYFFSLNININGKKYTTVEVLSEYSDKGAKANFFSKNLSKNITITGKVDTNKIGSYELKYSIKYLFLSRNSYRIVKVVDKEKPVITLTGDSELDICPNKEYEEIGYSASDNYDGDLSNKVKIVTGDNEIVYSVKDSSKNETSTKRIINRVDKEKPIIKLKGSSTITVKLNNTYSENGATASDNCDGDLTKNIKVSSNVDTKKVGTYKVTYSVKDSNGNEASAYRTVKVTNEAVSSWYTKIIEGPTYIKNLLIVNKTYSIPESYGKDLNGAIDSTVMEAYNKFKASALLDGFTFYIRSGNRSYNTQKILYNRYVQNDGVTKADTYSARPGHSEHQTGLAFDLGCKEESVVRGAKVSSYIKEHCADYGFIVRYPDGKTNITGYQYEPWHLRYVGIEHATNIMKNNLTLEEYLGIA